MTTLLRLLLLLLMGSSLLAARWTDTLGQRPATAAAARQPQAMAQHVAEPRWLLASSWLQPAGLVRQPRRAAGREAL